MSKSSSRPQASVFGALGADDAYFSSRVQVAARDAEQRWPLLGGLSPAEAETPPPMDSGDRSQWAPRKKAEEPARSNAVLARKGLDAKLEAGLSRLLHQSDAEAASVAADQDDPGLDDEPTKPVVEAPVRRTPVAPPPMPAARRMSTTPMNAPAPAVHAPAQTAPRQRIASTPAAAPKPEPTRGESKLSDVFQRLARAEPTAQAPASAAARPSLLGRLSKR